MLSENIWRLRLVKQLWPPDGCRRAEGRLSTSLAAKGCVLTTQQERIFNWIDLSEWWWKEEMWTSRESLRLPCMWRYPIRAYKLLRVMFPVYKAPEPHSSMKNSCTLLFSGLRSSWASGFLSTLFSVWMKRGWMNVLPDYNPW